MSAMARITAGSARNASLIRMRISSSRRTVPATSPSRLPASTVRVMVRPATRSDCSAGHDPGEHLAAELIRPERMAQRGRLQPLAAHDEHRG